MCDELDVFAFYVALDSRIDHCLASVSDLMESATEGVALRLTPEELEASVEQCNKLCAYATIIVEDEENTSCHNGEKLYDDALEAIGFIHQALAAYARDEINEELREEELED